MDRINISHFLFKPLDSIKMAAADDDTEWSDKSYTFDEILKEFSPPLTVLVDEGYMQDEKDCLAAGEVITIQSQETIMQFKGFDEDNKRVCIPLKCPFKVKVVSKFEGRVFNSVKEISDADPAVNFVKVLSKGQKELAEVNKGDRLRILLSERDTDGPSSLHIRNQHGKNLRLPASLNGKFCECGENDDEYALKELVLREMPLYIKFAVGNQKNPVTDLVGIIKVTELVNETLTFCTSYACGNRFMAAFPASFGAKVRPPKSANVAGKSSIPTKAEEKRLQTLRQSVYIDNVVPDGQCIDIMQLEDVECHNELYVAPNGWDYSGKLEDIPDSNRQPDYVNMKDSVINRNDPKHRGSGFLSKVKSKLLGNPKSLKLKEDPRRPGIVLVRDINNGACSDGGDSGIYEEISEEAYMCMDNVDGVRKKIVRNVADELPSVPPSVPLPMPPSMPPPEPPTMLSPVPPPVPGNHPKDGEHSAYLEIFPAVKLESPILKELQPDGEQFQSFYDSMKRSQQELKMADMQDVAEILEKLKLGKYVERFQECRIDGNLLVDLDEAVLMDMELSPFESRKLRKYVFGWRPDNEDTEAFELNESNDNRNAMLWNENEVEAHINGLGMHELATFCKHNQINGNLLWDIVVDEDMISELIGEQNRKLNAIKLRNYVLEGWRPQKSKKQNSERMGVMTVRSKSFKVCKSLQVGVQKSNSIKITSNNGNATKKFGISVCSSGSSKDRARDAEKASISVRQKSGTCGVNVTRSGSYASSTRRAKQKSLPIYENTNTVSYKKTATSPVNSGASGPNGRKIGCEVPVVKHGMSIRVNTVTRQVQGREVNAHGTKTAEKSSVSRSSGDGSDEPPKSPEYKVTSVPKLPAKSKHSQPLNPGVALKNVDNTAVVKSSSTKSNGEGSGEPRKSPDYKVALVPKLPPKSRRSQSSNPGVASKNTDSKKAEKSSFSKRNGEGSVDPRKSPESKVTSVPKLPPKSRHSQSSNPGEASKNTGSKTVEKSSSSKSNGQKSSEPHSTSQRKVKSAPNSLSRSASFKPGSSANTNISKSNRELRSTDVPSKTSGSRSITPTSLTPGRGEAPRVVRLHRVTRRKSDLSGKTFNRSSSQYGKRSGSLSTQDTGDEKSDSREGTQTKTGRKDEQKQGGDNDKRPRTTSVNNSPAAKDPKRKSVVGKDEKDNTVTNGSNSLKSGNSKEKPAQSSTKLNTSGGIKQKQFKSKERGEADGIEKERGTLSIKLECKTKQQDGNTKITEKVGTVSKGTFTNAERAKSGRNSNLEESSHVQEEEQDEGELDNDEAFENDYENCDIIFKTKTNMEDDCGRSKKYSNSEETKKKRQSVAELKRRFDNA